MTEQGSERERRSQLRELATKYVGQFDEDVQHFVATSFEDGYRAGEHAARDRIEELEAKNAKLSALIVEQEREYHPRIEELEGALRESHGSYESLRTQILSVGQIREDASLKPHPWRPFTDRCHPRCQHEHEADGHCVIGSEYDG